MKQVTQKPCAKALVLRIEADAELAPDSTSLERAGLHTRSGQSRGQADSWEFRPTACPVSRAGQRSGAVSPALQRSPGARLAAPTRGHPETRPRIPPATPRG